MKHHTKVHPLIQTLIVCAIASLLAGGLAACGVSVSVGITGVTESIKNNVPTITVTYNLTESSVGYIEHQPPDDDARRVTLSCSVDNTTFHKSKTVEGAGPDTIDIQVGKNTEGSFTVTCSVMQNGQEIGKTSKPFSFTLVPCLNPQGGGPQVVLATEDCTPTPTDTPTDMPTDTPTPTDTGTATTNTGSGPYYIFVIAIESGGSIVVGTQADVQKPSCDFTDGGLCKGNDPNVQVLATLGGPYDTQDQAVAAYCQEIQKVSTDPFGGVHGTINGKEYWLDNAPSC